MPLRARRREEADRAVRKRIFDADNPLMRALAVAADLLLLNLLTLLCSLPVLTLGAALSALCDQVQRIVRGEESYVVRGFFRAFRSNLLQGSALGLFFLACGALIWLDYRLALTLMPMLRFAAAAVGILVLAVGLYAFPLQARFENSLGATLKNAATLAVGFFPRTAGMVVCVLALWLIALHFFNYALPVLLMFGVSLPFYVCALLYRDIFEKLETGKHTDVPAEREDEHSV